MIRHNSYMNTIHTKISQNTTFSKFYLLCTFPLPSHLEHPRVPFISDSSFCIGTTSEKYRITNNSHQHSAVAFSFSLTWAPAKSAWTRKRKSIDLARLSILARLCLEISKTRYLLYSKRRKIFIASPRPAPLDREIFFIKNITPRFSSFLVSLSLPSLPEFYHLDKTRCIMKVGFEKRAYMTVFVLRLG